MLVGTGEGEDAARVDTNALDGELFCWEVTTLDEEGLVNVIGDAGIELNLDLEPLIGEDLAARVNTFDHTRPRQSAEVDVELERHLANVLDEEVTRLALVVGYLTKVNLVGRELVGDVRGLTLDGHVVIGTSVNAHNGHA